MKTFTTIQGFFVFMLCMKGLLMASTLKVGDAAPLFEVATSTQTPFRLIDRKGLWTVLYFYPKDHTPGCNKQACAFRDSMSVIRSLGADVFGVSKDSAEKHRAFQSSYQLNFTLLADTSGLVMKAYGVSGFFGLYAKRTTFIIDPQLQIVSIQNNVDPATNAKEVSDQLSKLQNKK